MRGFATKPVDFDLYNRQRTELPLGPLVPEVSPDSFLAPNASVVRALNPTTSALLLPAPWSLVAHGWRVSVGREATVGGSQGSIKARSARNTPLSPSRHPRRATV